MQGVFVNKYTLGLLFFSLLFPGFLDAADQRTVPLNMYIIIDGSPAMKNGREAAVQWLCDDVVDRILREGDNLTVLFAAESVKTVYSAPLSGEESRGAAKTALRSLPPPGAFADYGGALREAASRESSRTNRGMVYTLLVSGSSARLSATSGGTEAAGLLRYSRIQDFPEWRAVVVGLGIGPRIQQAAAAYMR
jgi:hypothetical protein